MIRDSGAGGAGDTGGAGGDCAGAAGSGALEVDGFGGSGKYSWRHYNEPSTLRNPHLTWCFLQVVLSRVGPLVEH